jgi:hypothetical protein
MRFLLAVLAIAAATVLWSCGGSSSKTGANASATGSPSTPASTASSPLTTASTPTTTSGPAPASGPPPCRAGSLSLTFLGQQGATGRGELGFAVRNTSTRSCHTVGYPGVLFLDSHGAALPTNPVHATTDPAGQVPLRSLLVAPGASASFRLFVRHFTSSGSNAGCTTAYALQMIPPNDTATLRVTILEGGAYECGTASVSPMQPGTSAYR